MNKLTAFILLCMLGVQPAYSYSDLGHKMVAAIAWKNLTPYARQNISRILKPGEKRFVNASVWADHIKSDNRFNYLKPMHYVNLPRDATQYNKSRDCKKGKCVVEAIHTFSQVLKSGKKKDKLLALRMLIHLVGDIHQPMHAGLKQDRGGNWYEVVYQGKTTNLHKLWDTHLIKRLDTDWQEASQKLNIEGLIVDVASPEIWAQESHHLAVNFTYQAKENVEVSEAYLEEADELAKKQILVAGWRLAMWLNRLW